MRYARFAMVMRAPASARLWVVDPDDPRAPPDEIWEAMSPEERQRVVDSLPGKTPKRLVEVEQRLLAAEERADAEARLRVEAQARVAELEKKLSEASAKIARLTAERAATAGRSKKR